MTISDSTRPDWPFQSITNMTPHPGGQWVKKIHGKLRYFGAWANPDPENAKAKAALQKFLDFMQQADDPENTRAQPAPVVRPGELTINATVNGFMVEKHRAMEEGALSPRQFTEYRKLGDLIIATFGRERFLKDLLPTDFSALRSKLPGGSVRMGNEIVWTRSIFRWGADNHGVAIRYGSQFDKPARRMVRKATKAKVLYSPADIKGIIARATPAIQAMILLGINAGFGATDCATLPTVAVDLDKGVIDYDRAKTGVRRIAPLWPETVKALRDYVRPSQEHPELFFVTRFGNTWVHDEVHRDIKGIVKKVVRCDAVDLEFDKAQKLAGLDIRGFYLLRHTFRTVADETGDLNAIRVIMAHAFPGMDEFYLHINAGNMIRLRRVVDQVHKWLYGKVSKSASRRRAKKTAGERRIVTS